LKTFDNSNSGVELQTNAIEQHTVQINPRDYGSDSAQALTSATADARPESESPTIQPPKPNSRRSAVRLATHRPRTLRALLV
jgi:hypothetical protein